MGCNLSTSAPLAEQQQQQHGQRHASVPSKPTPSPLQEVKPIVPKAIHRASSKLSPVHNKLPPNAEQCEVRNVYDGDTFTLIDERRVRLLGIDTPEIKEEQPYAEEAKMFTKNLCNKKSVWLSYDKHNSKQDHYGRLLALVWVVAPDSKAVNNNKAGAGASASFLCVNEGLVHEGLACAYTPKKDRQPECFDRLVALQRVARENERGLWKNFHDEDVVVTPNGSAYHKRQCQHVSKIHNLRTLKASQGLDEGYHPCRTCMP